MWDTMRRSVVLYIAVAGWLLIGCFGSSTSQEVDSGPTFDSSWTLPEAALPESSPHQTPNDAGPGHQESGAPDVAQDVLVTEGAADAAVDAAVDASAAGTFSTAPLDFGLADCGGQPTPATTVYTFQNTGALPITWSASVGAGFSIQGATSGSVAAGASGSITIGVDTIPAASAAGVAITGALTIATNVPGLTAVTVPLTVTPRGGTLALTQPKGFGSVTLGTPATETFTLTNTGNAAVSVTLGAPTDSQFTVTYTGAKAAVALAPGQSLAGASATFLPTGTGPQAASASVHVTGVVCGSSADSIVLKGTGTTAALGVSPSALDFSTVTCGATAPSQAVTLTNSNGVAIPYTTSLGKGASSPYTLDAPSGTVPANGQAVLNVRPAPIPLAADLTPGFYDDTLTVTGQGLAPVTVALQESAGGAVLAIVMPVTDFGDVPNTTAMLPFSVTNSGNEDATVTVTASGAGFSATVASTAPANGGSAPGSAFFTATANAMAAGSLSVTASNLCAPLPTPVTLSAVGQVPIATFSKTPLAVTATCGGGATSATFVVQNMGNAPLAINGASSMGGYFSIAGFTSPIAPGGADKVTITGLTAGAAGSSTPYSDTLQFSTNEVGSPAYQVAVNDTVIGVNLSISPSTIGFTDCNNVSYALVVTGVLPAGAAGVTVQPIVNNYCVGDCAVHIGFGGAFDMPVTVSPGKMYTDSVYSDENSGCTPVNVTFLTATGLVCQSSLSISGTFTGAACVKCGSIHG
jgi:hypothetical protein